MDSSSTNLAVNNIDVAMADAIYRGLMSANQYRFLAERLLSAAPCSLLVFGLGHDASLWWHCTQRNATFVEDNPTYLTMAPAAARVWLLHYASRVGIWSDVPEPPRLLAQAWDYVLVDGPSGYHRSCPGRQIPIVWARQLARRQIFVHDYERPWERQLCDKILGVPVECVKANDANRGELAVFEADVASSNPSHQRLRHDF